MGALLRWLTVTALLLTVQGPSHLRAAESCLDPVSWECDSDGDDDEDCELYWSTPSGSEGCQNGGGVGAVGYTQRGGPTHNGGWGSVARQRADEMTWPSAAPERGEFINMRTEAGRVPGGTHYELQYRGGWISIIIRDTDGETTHGPHYRPYPTVEATE